MGRLTLMVLLIIAAPFSVYSVASYWNIVELQDKLLANYSSDIRPIKNQSETMNISLSCDIEGVMNVNDVLQTVSLSIVLKLTWTDELLQWNKDEYGIEYITIPDSKKWIPRLMTLNSMNRRSIFSDETHPYILNYKGIAEWLPATYFTMYCQLDMTYFPFDEQTCVFFILPVDFQNDQLNLYFAEQPELKILQENGEWDFTHLKAEDLPTKASSRQRLMVTITLTRRSTFILLNVFLPVIVLSFLNVAVFAVPSNSGEKLSYVLTVLLALAVFISVVSGMLPTTSTSISLITIYLSVQLILSTASVLLTVYVIRVNNRSSERPIPSYLIFLARIMKKKSKNRVDSITLFQEIDWETIALSVDKLCLIIFTIASFSSCFILLFMITLYKY